MLDGVQEYDDIQEEDAELDKKQAELERKLRDLLRDKSAMTKQTAKIQRSHDVLEAQAEKLKVAVVWSAITASAEQPQMTRYEQMRQRKDRKAQSKLRAGEHQATTPSHCDNSIKTVFKK